jgi:hypothetical protein
MVYKVKGRLAFATVAARDAAVTAVAGSSARTAEGRPCLILDQSNASAITIQTAYTNVVTAGDSNGALPGSVAVWHACYHGDLAQVCAITGRKVW